MPAIAEGKSGVTLRVEGLTKRFGRITAVDDLTFDVAPGRVTGFLGPNGAGKTTTLRCLLGLVSPTSGSTRIGSQPYRQLVRPTQFVGAALESTNFHPARTARNHLRIQCLGAALPPQRVDESLAVVGLTESARRRVGEFSLGMRQRLALAEALLGDPGVLILDEPANGLDPAGIAWLRGFLRNFAESGRTVLISSHALAEIAATVDDVVIVSRGRLAHSGSLDSLLSTTESHVKIAAPEIDRLAHAVTSAGNSAVVRRTGPNEIEVVGVNAPWVGALAFRENVELHELTEYRTDLEEVFLRLTAEPAPSSPSGATS
jgi:ABC-2 type transport system ATP-binding protein